MPYQKSLFPSRERLKSRLEISAVFKKGKKAACSGAALFYKSNFLDYNRIAFTFARKFGTAVKRNRARRLSREAYRLLRGGLKTGSDLVLLVYPVEGIRLSGRLEQLTKLFVSAGLFLNPIRRFEQ
ncbi:MAG: ribonuclease P protein component [Spirochaetaceae bacterium]|nr:ribonuclease P protein component [Spirochaetaceae bacterium]